uniref:L1 transposable element RRM domain-containing protein n=1 Tax=Echeneis naucrates TaxID=173247 RepID=A0A665T177_ECHNA
MQLTEEANVSSPGASRGASPAPSYDGADTEEEEEPVNLMKILKVLRGIGNEEKLQLKLTAMEAYSRRETLRLYGVPEGAESGSQSMIQFVEKLLRENLTIPPSTALQIQRAHRALSPLPPSGSQPRSILVKFLCFILKEEVLRLACQKKGFTWNNNKINLDHDYPPEIMAMRKEYAEARRILKEKNLRFRTLYPARLKVIFEEGVKIYNSVEEVTADLAMACCCEGMLCCQLIQIHAN